MTYNEERSAVTLSVHGKKIFGILHLPQGKKNVPCVLFCNGFGGNKCGKYRLTLRQAEQLSKAGIASFRFDYRGTGDSEGSFDEITLESQLEDTNACFEYLVHHDLINPNRIAIIGRSLGGAIATMAAAAHKPIALVLWAPLFDTIPWFNKEVAHKAIQVVASDKIFFAGVPLHPTLVSELQSLDIRSHLMQVEKTPFLIVQGEKDTTLGMYHYNKYRRERERSKEMTTYLTLPGSDHDFEVPGEQEMLLQKTTDWLISYM
jgi:uncharacterized protein